MVVYFSFCYTVCYREVIELKELEVEVGVEWGFWWGCFFFILQVGEIRVVRVGELFEECGKSITTCLIGMVF